MTANSRKKDTRTNSFTVRIPKGFEDRFYEMVARSGLSRQGFMWSKILDEDLPRQVRRPSIAEKQLVTILFRMTEIRDLCKEAVLLLKDRYEEPLDIFEQIQHSLLKIRADLFKALNRKG